MGRKPGERDWRPFSEKIGGPDGGEDDMGVMSSASLDDEAA